MKLIPLEQLRAHPRNSNVMPAPLLRKLKAHIGRTDRYPPIIVRPLPPAADAIDTRQGAAGRGGEHEYQILDGHHRVEVLRSLARYEARCVVWDVDDDEAMLLLATLNRLQGCDDPKRRAALLDALAAQRGGAVEDLEDAVPEDRAELSRCGMLADPPPPREATKLADMPVAVHFFLSRADKNRLERRLRRIGGEREKALMQLIESGSGD